MNKNEFDQLLKEQFDRHEFPYNRAGWERLEAQLPTDSRKVVPLPWLKLTGIAAALLLAVSTVAWLYNSNNGTVSVDPTLATTAASPHNSVPSTEALATARPVPAAEMVAGPPSGTAASRVIQPANRASKEVVPAVSAASQTETKLAAAVEPAAPRTERPSAPEPQSVALSRQPATGKTAPGLNTLAPDVREPAPRRGRTSFSLTGGMNYGSMNTGYMAGVNARRKLGGKIFIEGDLGIVSNTASQTFTPNPNNPPPGASSKGAPIDYRNTNLVYVQVNPTLGYQVMKHISLGVGADMQRMLNGSTTLVSVNDEVKSIPETDIGLTGKTEVSLSRKLRAGVLYREGINNFINSSSEYFDRRYLQVQLKLTVFGK